MWEKYREKIFWLSLVSMSFIKLYRMRYRTVNIALNSPINNITEMGNYIENLTK